MHKENDFNIVENNDPTLKELILKIKFWINFLKSNLKKILIITFFGGLIGLMISIFDKPTYKATLTFAMEDDKNSGSNGLSGALGLASSFGIDLGVAGGGAFSSSNLSELMKSHLIVNKVLLNTIKINNKETTLIDYYLNFSGFYKKWENDPELNTIKFPPNLNKLSFTRKQDSIIKEVYKDLLDNGRLSISQIDKKVTILSIIVKSQNELFAKYFCENLAKETSEFYISTRSKKSKINVDVLQKQVDSVKLELGSSITGVATAVDNVYNLNPAYNLKGTLGKKKQVDVQANTAILTNLVVQLELAKITLRKETPLIQLIDQPVLPLEIDRYSKIKSTLIGMIFSSFLFSIFLILSQLYKKFL